MPRDGHRSKCEKCGLPSKARRKRCGTCGKLYDRCCQGDETECSRCYEKGAWIRQDHSMNHGK